MAGFLNKALSALLSDGKELAVMAEALSKLCRGRAVSARKDEPIPPSLTEVLPSYTWTIYFGSAEEVLAFDTILRELLARGYQEGGDE